MSPRAAWRLESLMFDRVYDYVAGKDDWLSHGLPIEGELAERRPPVARDVARKEVQTCRYTDRIGLLSNTVRDLGKTECVVLNGEGVVLGRLSAQALEYDPNTQVDRAMEPGPSTIRPGTPLEEITGRMNNAGVDRVLVTTAEGKLVGVLHLEDAEERLAQTAGAHRQ